MFLHNLENHNFLFKHEQKTVKIYLGELEIYEAYIESNYDKLKMDKITFINMKLKSLKNEIDGFLKVINYRKKHYTINQNSQIEYI